MAFKRWCKSFGKEENGKKIIENPETTFKQKKHTSKKSNAPVASAVALGMNKHGAHGMVSALLVVLSSILTDVLKTCIKDQ
jgi:hypothetical protein